MKVEKKRENTKETLIILDKMIQEYEGEYNQGEQLLDNGEEIFDKIQALKDARKLVLKEKIKKESKSTIENKEKVRYSILDVLELDRKRIARDLHDSSVQILTMLVHKAELCEKLIEIDTIRTKMELHIMSDVLKDAISELRQTIFNLRPMTMDDLGLMDSIERYVQILIQSSDVVFRLNIEGGDRQKVEMVLNSVQKLSLYRILQECCSNIIKHSMASNALITIKLGRNSINLIVEDNGKGFSKPGIINKVNEISDGDALDDEECLDALTKVLSSRTDFSGYGLSMLQERVYLLNGKLHISTNDKGSRISVVIPTNTQEED